jgi:hypothetical protein
MVLDWENGFAYFAWTPSGYDAAKGPLHIPILDTVGFFSIPKIE